MKTPQQLTGTLGENFAIDYLKSQGYEICCRNWRKRGGEIDIIAMESAIMVFCEVKTRIYRSARSPEESVTLDQWRRIALAAGAYMEHTGHNWEVRFDIISIILVPGEDYVVEHFKDMYFPGR